VHHAKAEKLERGESLETDRRSHVCFETLKVDHGRTASDRGKGHERRSREGEIEACGNTRGSLKLEEGTGDAIGVDNGLAVGTTP